VPPGIGVLQDTSRAGIVPIENRDARDCRAQWRASIDPDQAAPSRALSDSGMSEPIAAWHGDHVRFARLLDALEGEVARFHAADTPDYERMRDIVLWLRHYADGVHHPREDAAFERLVRRDPSLALPVNRLLQEHRVIAHAGEALLEQLENAANGGFARRADLETAAATFLVYYRNHLDTEEKQIMPRAAALLDAADWAEVAATVPLESGRAADALRAARALGL
jgi:hemerythrin-like domain-containing protein